MYSITMIGHASPPAHSTRLGRPCVKTSLDGPAHMSTVRPTPSSIVNSEDGGAGWTDSSSCDSGITPAMNQPCTANTQIATASAMRARRASRSSAGVRSRADVTTARDRASSRIRDRPAHRGATIRPAYRIRLQVQSACLHEPFGQPDHFPKGAVSPPEVDRGAVAERARLVPVEAGDVEDIPGLECRELQLDASEAREAGQIGLLGVDATVVRDAAPRRERIEARRLPVVRHQELLAPDDLRIQIVRQIRVQRTRSVLGSEPKAGPEPGRPRAYLGQTHVVEELGEVLVDAKDHVQVATARGDRVDIRRHRQGVVRHTISWVEETASAPGPHDRDRAIAEPPGKLRRCPPRAGWPILRRAGEDHRP